MHEWVAGTRAADHGDQLHRHLIYLFRRFLHKLNERLIRVGAGRWVAAKVGDLYIAETLCVEMSAQLLEDVVRMLTRQEAEVHFRGGTRGQDCFGTGTLITGC